MTIAEYDRYIVLIVECWWSIIPASSSAKRSCPQLRLISKVRPHFTPLLTPVLTSPKHCTVFHCVALCCTVLHCLGENPDGKTDAHGRWRDPGQGENPDRGEFRRKRTTNWTRIRLGFVCLVSGVGALTFDLSPFARSQVDERSHMRLSASKTIN